MKIFIYLPLHCILFEFLSLDRSLFHLKLLFWFRNSIILHTVFRRVRKNYINDVFIPALLGLKFFLSTIKPRAYWFVSYSLFNLIHFKIIDKKCYPAWSAALEAAHCSSYFLNDVVKNFGRKSFLLLSKVSFLKEVIVKRLHSILWSPKLNCILNEKKAFCFFNKHWNKADSVGKNSAQ